LSANPRSRLALLGSGKGSNAAAIMDACASGHVPANVTVVLSDVADAGILSQARARGVLAEYIPPGAYRTKLDDRAEAEYLSRLQAFAVDYVVLAGFMRILKGAFLRAFADRVVNIHPSLLPAFPGLAAWRQALECGVKITGCTVHLVDEAIDGGAILGQMAVPVLDGDTEANLHARIQTAEHRLYPAVIAALVRGEIRIEGRRTRGFAGPMPLEPCVKQDL
jgi:phosphoribosylglycinamide formyltransferase-1